MSDGQQDVLEVEDIEVFEILNNPARLRIMRRLVEPKSIREVAESLEVPPTRLYYHFNLLEEAGVIEVVETRKVGAMLQKVFQTVAKSFRPSPKLVEGDHAPHELAKIAAATVIDGARLDAEQALTHHLESVRAGDVDADAGGSLGRSVSFLTEGQAKAFSEKLEKLVAEEFESEDTEEGTEYGFTYVFFPLSEG